MNAQSADVRRLLEARHHDPFAVLGRHATGEGRVAVRAFRPGAADMAIEAPKGSLPMERVPGTDLFEWHGPAEDVPEQYRLRWEDAQGHPHTAFDPYAYGPQLGDLDLHLFGEGRHYHAYRFLGAYPHSIDGVEGVLFATWAPNAERVSVVGDFNDWDGRCHPMRSRGGGGVWELFIPGLSEGMLYKFELFHQGSVLLKTDPYGRRYELRPNNAGVVTADDHYQWGDKTWLQQRAELDWQHAPLSVYEVHLGSWQRGEDGAFLNYREIAHRLVDYLRETGFTHIELLPVTEHPLDASWGYQASGYYAPTSRFGSPDDFRYFVDHCHQHGIGVFLDWVPAHFPRDTHALARFDGTPLYEHEDPRRGEHRDWGTLIFNFGRNEVKNFLISSALFWMQEMHLDGLRVDAVASMLYLDYSRDAGDWVPNVHGGRENLEAIEFLREMNRVLHTECPGILTMAEESTSWPMVSRPTWLGGLGFSMKWNMGWMNDTLEYIHKDPIYRRHHHSELTFGLLYAFTENFILPFSHDEVVHMKRSMLDKMPGDDWQRFANLRLLYTYMFTHPGKKLLFMGNEFAHGREWDERQALDWYLLDYPHHRGVQQLVRDLNHLYLAHPGLHYHDFDSEGFEWVDCNDADRSLLSYLRRGGDETLLVVLNFTPMPHEGYRIGVPEAGGYEVVFNSDSEFYGGSNMGNGGVLESGPEPWMGQPHSLVITVPPLAGVVLRKVG